MAPNLLGNYLEDERSCLIHGITYTEALTKACRESINAESKEEQWKQVECKIRQVRGEYSQKMGESFHHVLTELALLKFRYEREAKKSTIPVLLGGGGTTRVASQVSLPLTRLKFGSK